MRASWLCFAVLLAGCHHMGGLGALGHLHVPSGTFHASAPAFHASPSAPAVHGVAAPSFHASVSPGAAEVVDTAATLVDLAARGALVAEESVPPDDAPVAAPEPLDATLRWGGSATLVVVAPACSGARSSGLGGLLVHRNEGLTLYLASQNGRVWIPGQLDVQVNVEGPLRLSSMDGNAVTLVPNGPLGASAHVEVFQRMTGERLLLDVATADSDAPCQPT